MNQSGRAPLERLSLPLGSLWALLHCLVLLTAWATPGIAAPLVGEPLHTNGGYRESTEDLRVKVQGGFITVDRTWNEDEWEINPRWNALELQRDPADDGVKRIVRNGDEFDPASNDPDLFRFGKRRLIEKTETGYRWSDAGGNWIEYDDAGRVLRYGDRNTADVSISYDAEGRRSGVFDYRDEQILWYEYDEQDRLARIRDYNGRVVRYGYGGGEHMTTVTDLRGNTWSYGYSGDLLTSKTDPEGRTITLTYNGQNRLVEVADGLGVWRSYVYDYNRTRREFLFRETDGTGRQKDSWYASDGRLVRSEINGATVHSMSVDGRTHLVTDYSGLTTRLEYDEWDNLTSVGFPDGTTLSTSYDGRRSLPLTVTNERGIVTRYEYDERGNRTRMVEAAGTDAERITEYTYDDYGNQLTVRRLGDALTQESTLTRAFDAFGNMTSETDAEGNTTELEHAVTGTVSRRVSARGHETVYDYDAAGNLIAETDALGHAVGFAYDKLGNLISRTDQLDKVTGYGYDLRNYRTSVTDADDKTSTTQYDAAGRRTAEVDPLGRTTTTRYDASGRPAAMINPAGDRVELRYAAAGDGVPFAVPASTVRTRMTETYRYDRRGRRVRTERQIQGGPSLVEARVRDARGNVTAVTDAAGRRGTAGYDPLDRLLYTETAEGARTTYQINDDDKVVSVTNPRDVLIRSFAHDRNGNLLTETWPDGETFRWTHGPTGKPVERVDAKGQVIRYEYDELDRMSAQRWFASESAAGAERSVTYEYDARGNLVGYQDGGEGAVRSFDDLNRLISETVDFGTFSATYGYEYFADNRKAALQYPDGTRATFTYDAAGRLEKVTASDAGDIRLGPYDHGNPAAVQYPGGTTRSVAFDGLERVTSVSVADSLGRVLMEQGLTYDLAGNILTRTTEHGAYQYRYDLADRLVAVDYPESPDEAFGYDANGNRIEDTAGTTWSYNAADQLLNDGARDYGYDANGNLVLVEQSGGTVRQYEWDLSDRLVGARDGAEALLAEYAYDPLQRMTRSAVGSQEVYFLNAEEGPIAELNADGSVRRLFGWYPHGIWGTKPLWIRSGARVDFPQSDHMGTPWLMVDGSGTPTWQARYGAFGSAEVLIGAEGDNPWRFPGQYARPETGLYYNLNRHYAPDLGRYTRADPFDSGALINAYAYAGSNPITGYDPFGLFCMSVGGSVGAAVGLGGEVGADIKCCIDKCGPNCCGTVELCICYGWGGGADGGGPSGSGKGGLEAGPCNLEATPTAGKACCKGKVGLGNIECGVCGSIGASSGAGASCCSKLGGGASACGKCEAQVGTSTEAKCCACGQASDCP